MNQEITQKTLEIGMQSNNYIPAIILPDCEKINGSGWKITESKQPEPEEASEEE
ncbi:MULTISPECIES: hypothetical protein [unclassified Cedecea]|uniref:hypothetical protein n=1 Tax=unclassified Cedecea TaxID=2649846 RepID=UPI003015EA26